MVCQNNNSLSSYKISRLRDHNSFQTASKQLPFYTLQHVRHMAHATSHLCLDASMPSSRPHCASWGEQGCAMFRVLPPIVHRGRARMRYVSGVSSRFRLCTSKHPHIWMTNFRKLNQHAPHNHAAPQRKHRSLLTRFKRPQRREQTVAHRRATNELPHPPHLETFQLSHLSPERQMRVLRL